jgi:subfamily B ATP-binding cassette protein HlyB/CyaB
MKAGQHDVDESAFRCVAAIASTLGLQVSPERLRATDPLANGARPDDVLRLARTLGLRGRHVRDLHAEKLRRMPLPAVARMETGVYVVVARAWEKHVLVHDVLAGTVERRDAGAFSLVWGGDLILITTVSGAAYSDHDFSLRWFIPSIVRYRRVLIEVLAASVVLQLLALAMPLVSQVVIDKVLVHQALQTLQVLVLGFTGASIFESLLTMLRSYTLSHTTNRIDAELGVAMLKHLLVLPLAYFQTRRVGDSVARMRELENIRAFLTGNAITVLLDCCFAAVFLSVMFAYSLKLTLIVLAFFPAYVLLSVFVSPVLRARAGEKYSKGADNQAFLVETVAGIETIKAMAVEPHVRGRWDRLLASYITASFRVGVLASVAGQLVKLVNKLTSAVLLWFGAQYVIKGELTVGEFVAFNMLAARVGDPILRMAQLWQDYQQVRVSVDRLGDILRTHPEPMAGTLQGTRGRVKGDVRFLAASFRFTAEGKDVLKDVSIHIKPGEIVGIVGPSGSGKSTLAKLVQRLYVCTSGRVLVDGMDVAYGDPATLRRQVGLVLQENVLFAGTVRSNIALAEPGATEERVIAAAQQAGAHDFIMQLPAGYDTPIGERGLGLSGGQRQRLAIARALLTEPPILILDEATSALDAESERVIHDNMVQICKGRTVLIIAHRLSAVRISQRIVTLEDGSVTEIGSHEDLLARNGRYASLWRLQTAPYLPADDPTADKPSDSGLGSSSARLSSLHGGAPGQ